MALGLVFIVKTLPFALASPLAGLLADRFDRKRLMIAADLARAAVVLGFLVVDREAELPLLYGLIALQMMIGAVFVPARSAAVPQHHQPAGAADRQRALRRHLVGAAGGRRGARRLRHRRGSAPGAVFVLDSASYLVSAAFIAGVHPRVPKPVRRPGRNRHSVRLRRLPCPPRSPTAGAS